MIVCAVLALVTAVAGLHAAVIHANPVIGFSGLMLLGFAGVTVWMAAKAPQ